MGENSKEQVISLFAEFMLLCEQLKEGEIGEWQFSIAVEIIYGQALSSKYGMAFLPDARDGLIKELKNGKGQ